MRTMTEVKTTTVVSLTGEEVEKIVTDHVKKFYAESGDKNIEFSWDKLYEGSWPDCSIKITKSEFK